jgi:hypothetical protein
MIDNNDKAFTTKKFNDLDYKTRLICVQSDLPLQINQIKIYKNRLKENYNREIKYLNDRIKSLESGYEKGLDELIKLDNKLGQSPIGQEGK